MRVTTLFDGTFYRLGMGQFEFKPMGQVAFKRANKERGL